MREDRVEGGRITAAGTGTGNQGATRGKAGKRHVGPTEGPTEGNQYAGG